MEREMIHEEEDKNMEDVEAEDVEEEVNIEYLNEKMESIMQKLESLNVDREIGEKEKRRETRLIIERIELENFKSYAGVRKIGPLHHSFNAVVGPNGSGKSNLMESLLFVFGKRAKRMRLNKLNELIHNSTAMSDLRFARVTIYFKEIKDIDEEKFEEVPGSEFVLSREVYRNGSSKYFFNHRDIHFDDLCGILEKKGIDLKHNRFLILQGEVEQISMMKPRAASAGDVGLLEFLEDIIGTSRYVTLIDKVGKDIDELSEIKGQKANRVKITRNELDGLEDIKNQSTEYYKKEKELHIFCHLDFLLKRHAINKQILDFSANKDKLNEALADVDTQIRNRVKENSFILEEHRKIRNQQDALNKKKTELTKVADALDEEDKVKRADIENYSKMISKTKTALEKLNRNYQSQSESIQTARSELPKKEKEITELISARTRVEQFVNEKEGELFEKTEKIQKKKREVEKELLPFQAEIKQNSDKIEANNSTINLFSTRVDKISEDLNSTEGKKNECARFLREKSDFLAQLNTSIRGLENSLRESRDNLARANSDLEGKYKGVQNLQAKLSEVKNSNHERFQRNNILDSLLRAQNEGKLNGIHGRLGDLGMIDSKFDVAVTTACSNNLDSIVVESVDHAQKCLDFLKKNNIGRATFLILEKVSWVESKMRENFRLPANCERLFDLVKYKNQRLAVAFYFALRDTLVAPDLKTASGVAYGSTRHRVVTINGELIEVSGTMSGGGKAKRGGMSNKDLGEEYSADYINRLNADYEAAVKDYEVAKTERNAVEANCHSLNAKLQESLIVRNKTENECSVVDKNLQESQRNFTVLKRDYDKCKSDIEKTEELKSVNNTLTEANQRLTEESTTLRDELNQIEEEIGKIGGAEFNQKKEDLKLMKRRIDTLEKEINSSRHLIENSSEILEKLKDEILQKEKVSKDYEDIIEDIKKEVEAIEVKGLETYAEIELCQREIDNLSKMFTEKSKEVEELKTVIKKMREDQEKMRGEINEIVLEVKKCEKNEKLVNEELNKNKKSFKKLIEEFGFIDDFDREVKGHKKIAGNQQMMVDDEVAAEEESVVDYDTTNKKRKGPSLYKKYVEAQYMDYVFKIEELEELSKATREISYEYTMLQTKINDMKPNMNSILVYKTKLTELKSREDDMNATVEKLNKAKQIFDCVKTRRFNEFMEGFNVISAKLKEMYQLITNGGDAELELLDSLDPFSEGILFSVRPFKKSWKQISNLSGGEKTLSSLSLIFALHHYKPSPLYVLDEIDAALDFKNVSIIANYIKDQTKNSQFIIISLRNHMFELANKLVGIYKTHDITKCLTFNPESSKLEDANKQAN